MGRGPDVLMKVKGRRLLEEEGERVDMWRRNLCRRERPFFKRTLERRSEEAKS